MTKTTCPDCGSQLKPIKLIDATGRAFGEGLHHVELAYAASDADSGWFGIPPTGKVQGQLCPNCGRMLLCAAPLES